MPTDGADFQRRRHPHGRYYVELKNGANEERLAEVGVAGLAREIAHDRKMPMLKPMIDALLDVQPGTTLFGASSSTYAREVSARLDEAAQKHLAAAATREVQACVLHAAMRLREGAAVMSPEAYRDALFGAVGHELFQAKVLDFADTYTMAHCKLDSAGLERFEQNLHLRADAQLREMTRSIYESPSGTPASKFRHVGEQAPPVQSDSAEALRSTVLNPVCE
jgi:hypothetical protein